MSKSLSHLEEFLNLFHLQRSAKALAEKTQEAAVKNWSHAQFLEALLSEEAAARHERVVEMRVRDAKIPVRKTIEAFDWNHPTTIPRQLILNAFTFDFRATSGTTGRSARRRDALLSLLKLGNR